MSRPANPNWVVPVFAPDTAYPTSANPWSNTPTKTTHAGASSVGFTPKTAVPAQAINKLLNDAYTTDGSSKASAVEWANYVGQIQALNFPNVAGLPSISRYALFAAASCKWYVLANNETVHVSLNAGITWTPETGVGIVGAGENCLGGDADLGGNVVISTDTKYVFEKTESTGTWTRVDVVGGGVPSAGECQVAFDPLSGRWIWFGASGASTTLVKTSTNRTTWTDATTKPSGSWSGVSLGLACKPSNGRVIAMCIGSPPGTVRVATSDNGGVNWTDRATLTTTLPGTSERTAISYSEVDDSWICTLGKIATADSEVWRSTDDGVTWTKIATFGNACLLNVACLGRLLVSVAVLADGSSHIVYSLDTGVTWRLSGYRLQSTGVGVFRGGGRPLALTTLSVATGIAMGVPPFPVLT